MWEGPAMIHMGHPPGMELISLFLEGRHARGLGGRLIRLSKVGGETEKGEFFSKFGRLQVTNRGGGGGVWGGGGGGGGGWRGAERKTKRSTRQGLKGIPGYRH